MAKKKVATSKPRTAESARRPTDEQFPIVGVGASAGGLDALTALLKGLSPDTGMAFVVVQHMAPTHESILNKLLEKATPMPVAQVTDGMSVEPNRVYVIPPNTSMSIRDRVLRLATLPAGTGRHSPIDHFFESLAEDQRSSAAGVVLSGIGSDGTAGLRAIKAEGGITFAQDEGSAQYAGMPASAVASGAVDFISSPGGIAKELSRLAGHPYATLAKAAPAPELPPTESAALRRIFAVLRNTAGVDFSYYKPGTINRRIRRRMVVCKCENIKQYVQHLESNSAEADALFQDIIIHVTGFFREPEAFDALKTVVFPRLTANLSAAAPIRVWVPGCSSGEEVYSIAMCLLEFLGERASQTRIQIFGTDISLRDIEKARAGIYPETGIADVSQELLRRFFSKVDGGYQITKTVREMCVFARHDLVKDPPFSRIDLVSCRNVLIYLGPLLQKRVVAAFHYALNPDGMLLLGKSESVSSYPNLFAEEGRTPRIYIPKPADVQPLLDMGIMGHERLTRQPPRIEGELAAPYNLRTEGERLILERYSPPGFFVDANLHIVHIQGDTSPFVKPTPGEPSFHLLKMVRPELVAEVRTAIQKAWKERAPIRKAGIRIESNGKPAVVGLEVVPLPESDRKAMNFLVLFYKQPAAEAEILPAELPPAKKRSPDAKEIERLQRELVNTQEHLRSMIEDREASAEELRAANEEILSSNEELQSTNEELETAKEELQSSNEELTTLNEELQNRNTELAQLANDLSNLLTGVEIPVVIVGGDRRVRRFTPSAEKAFNLIPSDVGRPIGNLKPNIEVPDLEELAGEVLAKIRTVEREVLDRDGRWYSLRMRPYRTAENKIDGVLIALADIDALKRNLSQATELKGVAEAEREMALESLRASEAALLRSQDQLRSLAGRLMASEEERNRRLSRQLREDFDQRLAALGLDMAKLDKEAGSAAMRAKLQRMRTQLSALSEDIAHTAQRLHPTAVEILGLVSTVREECKEFSRREGIAVKVSQRSFPERLARDVGLCLFRVLQEALSNVARHSKADKVSVLLSSHPGGLRAAIRDNGVGFDPAKGGGGLGLVTIEERARTVGGRVTVNSAPKKGTEVVVEVPLPGGA